MFLPGVRLDVTRMILPSQPAAPLFIFKEMLMIKQQVPAKQNSSVKIFHILLLCIFTFILINGYSYYRFFTYFIYFCTKCFVQSKTFYFNKLLFYFK